MARYDRCEYCDYCQETGSQYAGVAPGQNGAVRLRWQGIYAGMLLCDACIPSKPKSSQLDGEVPNLDEDDETTSALSEL